MNNRIFNYLIRNYWSLLRKKDQIHIYNQIKNQKKVNDIKLTDLDEKFQDKVVKQLLSDYKQLILINYCPICGELARTPIAKSAKCGHTWYDKKTDISC